MAHLNTNILGRNLDGENRAEILNIAKLTLSNAAASAFEVMRKQEFDDGVAGLDSRLTAVETSNLHIDSVYVDETSADLVTALAEAGVVWNAGTSHWDFPGGIELATGDLLILNAAAEEEHRSWVMNNVKGGTVADFTPLGSDIDSSIDAAIAALKGDAAPEYDTLGKIEDVIIANKTATDTAQNSLDGRVTLAEADIDSLQTAQALRPEFKTHSGTFTQNGSIYELEFTNPYNTSAITVGVQSDESLGSWHVLSDDEVDIHVTDALISVTTGSSSVGAHTLRVLMNGIVA